MKKILHVLAWPGLLLLLAGCSSGVTQISRSTPALTSVPSATVTHTGVPAGTVLYQADWSHWSTSNAQGWKVVNGLLQSDAGKEDVLSIPYTPANANYAVEYRFQIVSVQTNGGYFLLKALRSPTKNGYAAGILGLLVPGANSEFLNPDIRVYLDPEDAMEDPAISRPSDYEAGTFWHTYRVEVQDAEVDFLADGSSKGAAISSETSQLSNGPLQVVTSYAVVRLSSLRILAL